MWTRGQNKREGAIMSNKLWRYLATSLPHSRDAERNTAIIYFTSMATIGRMNRRDGKDGS